MSSMTFPSWLDVRVEGHPVEFLSGGVLKIRFRQRHRKLYHSFEDQTMLIVQDQVMASSDFSMLHIPAHAFTSPSLLKLYLLYTPAYHRIIVQTQEAFDWLAQLIFHLATDLLKNGRNSDSTGLLLLADVELVTYDVNGHLEVEEESVPPSRGASENALRKLKREAGYEDDSACVVCLDELSKDITRMPCNHVLHTSCLLQWLKNTDTCPICRRQLVDD